MLHIGEGRTVALGEVIAILPVKENGKHKSMLLLESGQILHSSIATTTLKKRLQADPFGRIWAEKHA